MSGPRVVVVGGGLAGMAAALACADGGAIVTLLEARPRLGGATFSFPRQGLQVDNGQHVFLRCCTAYRSFLRRIGTDSPIAIESGPDDSYAASLVGLGNGTIIAAYDRVASEPAYGLVPRVFVKTTSGETRSRPVRTH